MHSLARHLGDADSHDRLPFHPSCPICRNTRLTGAVPADTIVSLRTQAVLAAGVLAVSATAPAVSAVAAEPDKQQEGAAPVAEGVVPDSAGNVDFDPGGESAGLPEVAQPVPPPPADPVKAEVAPEAAPAASAEDPVVDPGEEAAAAPAVAGSAEPSSPPATDAAPVQPAVTTTPSAPAEAAEPVPSAPSDLPVHVAETTPPGSVPSAAQERPRERQAPQPHRRAATGPAPQPPAAVPAPVQAAASPPVAAEVTVEVARGDRAKPGDRIHTVVAGESLWTIASDLLRDDAAPARVAREVHRLWELNRERIGTGDPDLLRVGTRLDLR